MLFDKSVCFMNIGFVDATVGLAWAAESRCPSNPLRYSTTVSGVVPTRHRCFSGSFSAEGAEKIIARSFGPREDIFEGESQHAPNTARIELSILNEFNYDASRNSLIFKAPFSIALLRIL